MINNKNAHVNGVSGAQSVSALKTGSSTATQRPLSVSSNFSGGSNGMDTQIRVDSEGSFSEDAVLIEDIAHPSLDMYGDITCSEKNF